MQAWPYIYTTLKWMPWQVWHLDVKAVACEAVVLPDEHSSTENVPKM